jgi:hypothetical protein
VKSLTFEHGQDAERDARPAISAASPWTAR